MNNWWTEQIATEPVASLSSLSHQNPPHISSQQFFTAQQVRSLCWCLLTCVGDLGRAGAGDAGASIWLGLAVGLGRGETSSGGDGVFAKRSGPESLDRSKGMARTYIFCCLITLKIWCNTWTASLMWSQWPQKRVHTGDELSHYIVNKIAIKNN